MDNSKSQLIDRLKTANTVLVTVSRNPSVDQLAACIGLTLIINKLNKHGSAVYSGETPSTIEFLKPEDTLEKTTDSLRDFIIALDKNKADKLRYKVEDTMVKIFITPYRTSLDESDLEFSQGDFNVELIVALGVQNQEDLDQAITAHGRILHDATVASINLSGVSNLGSINWSDPSASSLCELVVEMARELGEKILDEQIATALLTGIVAETERFSNEKTSSLTMSVSAELMAAGANQQLVATKLSEKEDSNQALVASDDPPVTEDNTYNDQTLNIDHAQEDSEEPGLEETNLPAPTEMPQADDYADDNGITNGDNDEQSAVSNKMITEPPQLGGRLTANSQPEAYEPSSDPFSNISIPSTADVGLIDRPTIQTLDNPEVQAEPDPAQAPESTPIQPNPIPLPQTMIDEAPSSPVPEPHNANSVVNPAAGPPNTSTSFTPPPPAWSPPTEPLQQPSPETELSQVKDDETLSDIEQSVHSPHADTASVDDARNQVDAVLAQTDNSPPEPVQALNALPLGGPLHQDNSGISSPLPPATDGSSDRDDADQNTTGLDPSLFSEPPTNQAPELNPLAPPVPPPIPMPYNLNDPNSQIPAPPST